MNKEIQQIIKTAFGREKPVILTHPKAEFGDYSTTVAMEMAKELGVPPREIAEKIATGLQQNKNYYDISVEGPGFINFRVQPKYLAQKLNQEWSDDFGSSSMGRKKTVIVEYPSNNMAKPYSIGHLRSGNQGWAIKKLYQKMGWQVITDNHLGDYGTPFGIWVVGFLNFSDEDRLKRDGVYELGRIYIKTKKALKVEKESGGNALAGQVQQWLLKLEEGDSQAVEFNQKFSKISLDHIHEIMGRLGIYTDHEYGEAFFAPKGKEIVQDLVNRGVAIKNEDESVVIDISEQGIKTPVLVQKSNGAALYATTDLATIIFRENEFHPDKVIYAVGDEQSFYFRQLFAIAKKLNIKTNLVHLNFGMIDQINEDGEREKMSSRKGVVLMEELLDTAEKKAKDVVFKRQQKDFAVSSEDIKKVALGAIKFSDFAADRRTNILFDWDTIFSLSGFSGPSVQYSAVRVNKIIQSSEIDEDELDKEYGYEPEKDLLLKIIEYPAVLGQAYENNEPHKIARYLYELSREMNRYYENTRVKDAPTREKSHRLSLLKKVSYVFNDGLDILGIEVPERM